MLTIILIVKNCQFWLKESNISNYSCCLNHTWFIDHSIVFFSHHLWGETSVSMFSFSTQNLIRQKFLHLYLPCVNMSSSTKLCPPNTHTHTHSGTHTLSFSDPCVAGLHTHTIVSLRVSQKASLPSIQLIPAVTVCPQHAWSINTKEESIFVKCTTEGSLNDKSCHFVSKTMRCYKACTSNTARKRDHFRPIFKKTSTSS